MTPAPEDRRDFTIEEALLWDITPTLALSVHFIEGREPAKLALDEIVRVGREVTGKSTVRIESVEVIPGVEGEQGRLWSSEMVHGFHDLHFPEQEMWHLANGTTRLRVIYLDGSYDSQINEYAIGLQSGHDLFIFPDRMRNAEVIPQPAADRVERAVLVHEFGHALGLVDCGVPMQVQRKHPDGCHSVNEQSVMYAGADSALMSRFLDLLAEGSEIHYRFDADDLSDLRAFRALWHSSVR